MASTQNAAQEQVEDIPEAVETVSGVVENQQAGDIEYLRRALAEVEAQRDGLQELIADLETDLSAVQEQLKHVRQERDEAAQKSGPTSDREITTLRVRYNALAEEVNRWRNGREEVEAKVGDLETKLREAVEARERIGNSLAAAQEQARSYEAALQRERRRVAELEARVKELGGQ